MRVTVLGCGPSGGVPLIGCDCAVCQSANPKNKRTRSSILVELPGGNLLIDTSPDLRQQALRHTIQRVDAVLFTHNHADHTHGIDELRSYNYLMKKPVPVYAPSTLLETLQQQFSYAFGAKPSDGRVALPALEGHAIPENEPFELLGARIQPILQYHGKGKSTGYRIGNFAYSTDVDNFPDESLQLLDSLDVWLVDCLQYEPAPSHAHLARTLAWAAQVKPKRTVLTHMNHALNYTRLAAELPPGIEPAYDGMQIAVV